MRYKKNLACYKLKRARVALRFCLFVLIMLVFDWGKWSQSRLMVANADLLENVHHVKLDPFFDDLSSFDEGDVYVSDGNSLSGGRNALILS